MREDKAHWPRCLLWHGWLPMLSGVNGASPWAADASESAFYFVETALGRYSSGLVSEWSPPYDFDADEVYTGVDNLGVVLHVGRLLDDCSFATPLELVTDVDLLILLRKMIDLRGRDTVRVTKVKGHADEGAR